MYSDADAVATDEYNDYYSDNDHDDKVSTFTYYSHKGI